MCQPYDMASSALPVDSSPWPLEGLQWEKNRISQGVLSAGSHLHCSWCSDASILQFLVGKGKLKKDCKGWGFISGPLNCNISFWL